MGRLKGGLIESVFDVTKRAPLDARELVTKYEDLINPSIWYITGTTVETLYDGLTVSVREVGPHMGKYFLTDRKAVTQENYNNYKVALENGDDTSIYFAMWEKLATEDFVLNTIGLPLTEQNVTIYELLQEETERAKAAEQELSLAINDTITGAKVGDTILQIVDRQILIPVEAIVKGTDEIAVSKNGELSINQLDVSKLVQTDDLILNGGNAD